MVPSDPTAGDEDTISPVRYFHTKDSDIVGLAVGDTVGMMVGDVVGLRVGNIVGLKVGDVVGLNVGNSVGMTVGDVGLPVGFDDGEYDDIEDGQK